MLGKIVKQLELCGYKDEHGHKLELNTAFINLKRLAIVKDKKAKEDEFFVTMEVRLPGVTITERAIWGRKKLESSMAYNQRIKAINEITDPSMLPMHMNIECTKCKRCVAHDGKCYGRVGATPCMGYEAT